MSSPRVWEIDAPFSLGDSATVALFQVWAPEQPGPEGATEVVSASIGAYTPPPELGLTLTPGRPLVGFQDPNPAAAAGAESPLRTELALTPGEYSVWLAVDASGLSAVDQQIIDPLAPEEDTPALTSASAARGARETARGAAARFGPAAVMDEEIQPSAALEGTDPETVTLTVPFTLRRDGAISGAPAAEQHVLKVKFAREPWPPNSLRIDLRALVDRRAFGRLDPPSDRRPELRALYPVLTESEAYVDIAEIIVSARGVSPIAKRIETRLQAHGWHPDVTNALSIIDPATQQDGGAVTLTPSPGGAFRAKRVLRLRCGPRGVSEPAELMEGPLQALLIGPGLSGRGGARTKIAWSLEHVLRVAPPTDPGRVEARIVSDGADWTRELGAFTLAGEPKPEIADGPPPLPERRVTPAALDDPSGRTPTARLLTVEVTLHGQPPSLRAGPSSVRLEAEAELLDHNGAPIMALTRLANALFQHSTEPSATLSPGARFARLTVAAPSARQMYMEALGETFDPDRPLHLRLKLTVSGAMTGVAELRRAFRLDDALRPNTLAIDFGADSVSAARADGSGLAATIPLGKALTAAFPASSAAETPFLDGAVGLEPEACWRAEALPESLWSVAPEAALKVDALAAAQHLKRRFAVSLPARGAAEAGAAQLRGLMSKLPAWGGAEPLAAPVRAVDAGGPLDRIAIDLALGDALHELGDLHLAYAEPLSTAPVASLALTCPSRTGPQGRRRAAESAGALARRLGLELDPRAVAVIPAADATAAYYIDRLPIDEEAGLRVLTFDLGARELSLALATAERAAPGLGAEVRDLEIAARAGAAIGAEAIDLTIYFIVHAALSRLPDSAPLLYAEDLLAPIEETRAEAPERLMKRRMARAIAEAKAALTDACRIASSGGRYGWADGVEMEVQVGDARSVAGGSLWPVATRGGLNGDKNGSGFAEGEIIEIDPGLRLTRRNGALKLLMSREAVAGAAMTELLDFVCDRAIRLALPELEAVDMLVVSGRGALFPLVYDRLAQTLEAGGVAERFAFPQPDRAETMKAAAALGAARLTAEGYGERLAAEAGGPGSGRYAMLITEREVNGDERARRLIPEGSFPAMGGAYVGRLRLMEAPAGLTAEALNTDPFASTLLTPVGLGGEARALGLTSESPPPQIRLDPDGRLSLIAGETPFSVDAAPFRPFPVLHRAPFDVRQEHAPPGWPDDMAERRASNQAVSSSESARGE
ncbi:MAG: hypothetical protein KTR21_08460 [Rhodobacteraceae bacterium]|nr:hypothetical protein [Paracoccaceae bacterium]